MDLPASSSRDTGVPELNEEQTDTCKFVLPPEYDKNDSRWTLKYREPAPGLVELVEHSSVYVNADKLAECTKLSKDCQKLSEMLASEVFTTNALSACALPAALCNAFGIHVEHGKPELPIHATTTLLNFVAEYGLKNDWKVDDYGRILTNIRTTISGRKMMEWEKEHAPKPRFVLPPEYDKNDSRWTLKYGEPAQGLVELMEHSGVYVNADKLAECTKLSKDCQKLSEMLASEVFTTNALSACALPAALCNAFGIHVEHGKPELPIHATTTLLNFVAEYGLKNDWKVDDYGRILSNIRTTISGRKMMEWKKEHAPKPRFVLPPEYDKNDSRWTLKYREPAPGLVELIEHSGVYVNADKLADCKKLSTDCQILAVKLLSEIFTRNALRACALPPALCITFRINVEYGKPELDSLAITTLLKFVAEYGLEKDWKVDDYGLILRNICTTIDVTSKSGWMKERARKRSFFLPPEYDENDSRWTLKYREPAPGLVELMEHSCVYVNAEKLADCKKKSKNCRILALKLLDEVFATNALGACVFPAALCNTFRSHVEYGKPELDSLAITTLLKFVAEYGLEKDWKVEDNRLILRYISTTIDIKMRMIERMKEHGRKHRLVLPPEYDENNSRWTLNYREPAPGLVELMEHSGVYVNADKLADCKNLSKNCPSLARKLLSEVFTTNALSACTLPAALCNTFRIPVECGKPELDSLATTTILKFVAEYGLEQDWKVNDYNLIVDVDSVLKGQWAKMYGSWYTPPIAMSNTSLDRSF